MNGYERAHYEVNRPAGNGYNKDFHVYSVNTSTIIKI